MFSKVCEFSSDYKITWNEAKMMMHFSTEDAHTILNTHIPQVCTKDKIACIHSPNG